MRYWVDKILELGNKTGSAEDRIRSGYRALARQCHPDVGGTTTQMQAVGEAAAWLRANKAAVDVPGSEPFASSLWDDEIPFDGDDAPFGGFDEAPITQLDDDDIPF